MRVATRRSIKRVFTGSPVARLMHRLIRGSRLHVYSGGHLGLLTEAAGLAPVVDGFLSGP